MDQQWTLTRGRECVSLLATCAVNVADMSVSIGTSYIIHPTGISTFVRTSSHHERHPIESSTASCVTTVPQIRKQASVMLSFPDMLISHAVNLPTRYFPKKIFFF